MQENWTLSRLYARQLKIETSRPRALNFECSTHIGTELVRTDRWERPPWFRSSTDTRWKPCLVSWSRYWGGSPRLDTSLKNHRAIERSVYWISSVSSSLEVGHKKYTDLNTRNTQKIVTCEPSLVSQLIHVFCLKTRRHKVRQTDNTCSKYEQPRKSTQNQHKTKKMNPKITHNSESELKINSETRKSHESQLKPKKINPKINSHPSEINTKSTKNPENQPKRNSQPRKSTGSRTYDLVNSSAILFTIVCLTYV